MKTANMRRQRSEQMRYGGARARCGFTLFLALFWAARLMADASLTVGSLRGEPGSMVSIPLTLTGATNVVALQGDVLFDASVLSAGATTGGPALSGQILGYSQVASGVHRVLIYSLNNTPLATGVIANLKFSITPQTPASTAGLLLTNVILATASASEIASSNAPGLIAINLLQVRTNGAVNGFLFGIDGQRYVVQATTNFINWVNIYTNVAIGSFIQFIDADAPRYHYRFYRGAPMEVTLVAPAITLQPQNQIIGEGGTATFSVSVTGSPPLSYQWRFNQSTLPGATDSTLVLTNVQHANEGIYRVTVSNPVKTITSKPATLTVAAIPSITQQPVGTNVAPGATVTLQVQAAGAPTLRYQWRRNGTAVDNATNAALVLSNIQANRAGDYVVVVSNLVGSVTSQVARVSVSMPVLLGWRANQTNNQLQLHVTWTAAQDFTLQASTNLMDWRSIATNAAASQTFEFVDPEASRYPQRFYRVKQ